MFWTYFAYQAFDMEARLLSEMVILLLSPEKNDFIAHWVDML